MRRRFSAVTGLGAVASHQLRQRPVHNEENTALLAEVPELDDDAASVETLQGAIVEKSKKNKGRLRKLKRNFLQKFKSDKDYPSEQAHEIPEAEQLNNPGTSFGPQSNFNRNPSFEQFDQDFLNIGRNINDTNDEPMVFNELVGEFVPESFDLFLINEYINNNLSETPPSQPDPDSLDPATAPPNNRNSAIYAYDVEVVSDHGGDADVPDIDPYLVAHDDL